MIYFGLIIYIAFVMLLFHISETLAGGFLILTFIGFYLAVVLDERDRRKRGEIR